MKVYIAGKFETLPVVDVLAQTLQKRGHEVVSRWHKEESVLDVQGSVPESVSAERAWLDLMDVEGADAFVLIAFPHSSSGGKHVEMGYALALEIPVIVLGEWENIFQLLPGRVSRVYTWRDVLLRLDDLERRRLDEVERNANAGGIDEVELNDPVA